MCSTTFDQNAGRSYTPRSSEPKWNIENKVSEAVFHTLNNAHTQVFECKSGWRLSFFFLFFFLSFSSYLDENCFDTNLFTSPGCLVKQPTNCSRLSLSTEPFFSASSSFWLFCSGGMWTIAHPSSAEPSWRPSIRMKRRPQPAVAHPFLFMSRYLSWWRHRD